MTFNCLAKMNTEYTTVFITYMHLHSQPRIYVTHRHRLITICISFSYPPLMKSMTPIVFVWYQPPVAHNRYPLERSS